MRIEKVINNNVVCSRDEKDIEIVIMGKGIGFRAKAGAVIDEKKNREDLPYQKSGDGEPVYRAAGGWRWRIASEGGAEISAGIPVRTEDSGLYQQHLSYADFGRRGSVPGGVYPAGDKSSQ